MRTGHRCLGLIGAMLTLVMAAWACAPTPDGGAGSIATQESNWTPPPMTVPGTGEVVTDVYALSLTPEQQDKLEKECLDAEGVPQLATESCPLVKEFAGPYCQFRLPCLLVGMVAGKDQAFVRVVAPDPEQPGCPTLKRLCQGVVTTRATYEVVRHAATASSSPTSARGSQAATNPPTPAESSGGPGQKPSETGSSASSPK